jgi:outer membrane scaffolding protein for murein synthesis (MipA/OmpV family)
MAALLCVASLYALSASHPASAADILDQPSLKDGSAGTGWIVSVGIMAQYEPKFVGSDKYGLGLIPQFSFRKEGEPRQFSAPDDGISYAFYDTPTLKIGPVASIEQGRERSDDHRLDGLDNFAWRIGAGAFVEYWPVPDFFRTRVEVMHGFRDDDGFFANLSADFIRHYGRYTFSAGPRMVIGDSDSMNFLFGVSDAAAIRNGRVGPFDADGGIQSVGANATVSYDWSEDWRLTGFARYDRLVGDAADSPITREFGSENQFTLGAGVTYSFHLGN